MMNKPQPHEYAAFYGKYIALLGENPVLDILESLSISSYTFFNAFSDEQANYAYAPGKWTIKETLGHMIDAERTFAYRLFAFSRGQEELPGFDENTYVENSTFNSHTIQDLAAEFKTTRESNLYLLRALTPQQLAKTGLANGYTISVLAIVYIMAGHELHHLNIIKERYLS